MTYEHRRAVGGIGGVMTIANHGAREVAARARTGIAARWLNEARRLHPDWPEGRLEECATYLYRADMRRRSLKAVEARRQTMCPPAPPTVNAPTQDA